MSNVSDFNERARLTSLRVRRRRRRRLRRPGLGRKLGEVIPRSAFWHRTTQRIIEALESALPLYGTGQGDEVRR
jgi:hypothetical protein